MLAIVLTILLELLIIFNATFLAQQLAGTKIIRLRWPETGCLLILAYFLTKLISSGILLSLDSFTFSSLTGANAFCALAILVYARSLYKTPAYELSRAFGTTLKKLPPASRLIKLLKGMSTAYILLFIFLIVTFAQLLSNLQIPNTFPRFTAALGLKSALMVAQKGFPTLQLNGSWSTIEQLPANLECIFASLMLTERSELFVKIFQAVLYFMLPLPLLAYRLRNSSKKNWVFIVLLLWSLPPLRRSLFQLDWDITITFFYLYAAFLCIEISNCEDHPRKPFLLGLVIGLVLGIKPLLGIPLLILPIGLRIQGKQVRTILLGMVLLITPWMLRALVLYGTPFAPFSLPFFEPGSSYLSTWIGLSTEIPYQPGEELAILPRLFVLSDVHDFGPLTAVLLYYLGLSALAHRDFSKRKGRYCLLLLVASLPLPLSKAVRDLSVYGELSSMLVAPVAVLIFLAFPAAKGRYRLGIERDTHERLFVTILAGSMAYKALILGARMIPQDLDRVNYEFCISLGICLALAWMYSPTKLKAVFGLFTTALILLGLEQASLSLNVNREELYIKQAYKFTGQKPSDFTKPTHLKINIRPSSIWFTPHLYPLLGKNFENTIKRNGRLPALSAKEGKNSTKKK